VTRAAIRWRGAASKYHATAVTVDGERFASLGELRRYHELKILVRAGQVRELHRQVPLDLHARGAIESPAIGKYIADFVYEERETDHGVERWAPVVEDFKGVRTPLYCWKRRHVELEYGIRVRETSARRRADA
jgi:hypothetical protein